MFFQVIHIQPYHLLRINETQNMKSEGIHNLVCSILVQYYLKHMDNLFPHNPGVG